METENRWIKRGNMEIFGIVITTQRAIEAEYMKRNKHRSERECKEINRTFELIKENSRLKAIILERNKV
jgi:hypothetical protein